MVRYYEHRGIHIEVFYNQNGTCYCAFDDYETDVYQDFKLALKDAIAIIDRILSGVEK